MPASFSKTTTRESRRQARALIEVRLAREELQRWPGRAIDIPKRLIRAYSGAMHRACRVGLATHPEVAPWVEAQKCVGNWDSLRRARLTRGVQKPMSPPESKLLEAVAHCLYRDVLRRASSQELVEIKPHMSAADWRRSESIVFSSDEELSSWADIQRLLSASESSASSRVNSSIDVWRPSA